MSDLKQALKELYEQRSALKARITEAICHIESKSLRSDSFRDVDHLFLQLKKIEQQIEQAESQFDMIEKPPDFGGEGTQGKTT